jgi:hypothetical protein
MFFDDLNEFLASLNFLSLFIIELLEISTHSANLGFELIAKLGDVGDLFKLLLPLFFVGLIYNIIDFENILF